jgi:hypothetical protein
VVDAYVVADAQVGERGRGADGVDKVAASVDGVSERGEMVVELAVCDRV